MHKGSKTNQEHHHASSLLDLCANFPERCPQCGEVHNTLLDHHKITPPENPFELPNLTDKKAGKAFETRIQCDCGHESKVITQDRRDNSRSGIDRRRKFDEMLAVMMARGIKKTQAKEELRKNLRGEDSELVNRLFRKD